MKALVTGERGYIGTRLCEYLNKEGIFTARVSARGGISPEKLIGCDVLVHAAALVHQTDKNIPYEKYLEINTVLTRNIADAAVTAGVGHFIFFSTMAVFEGHRFNNGAYISDRTDVSFTSPYASTKYGAEELLKEYGRTMTVSVLRPPLVYGKGSPGNFGRLIKLSKKIPVFPDADNCRSMIYIDNLCELVRLIILNKTPGYFHPQNADYMNTSRLVRDLGRLQGNAVQLVKAPGPIVRLSQTHSYGKKLFGAFAYNLNFSAHFDGAYNTVGYMDSLVRPV